MRATLPQDRIERVARVAPATDELLPSTPDDARNSGQHKGSNDDRYELLYEFRRHRGELHRLARILQ